MNSRERVLNTIKREQVDRIPCNFRAEIPTLKRLYDYIGHNDYDRLLFDLHIDIRYVDSIAPPEKDFGGYIQNYWGERYIYRQGEWGAYRDDMPGALSEAKTLKEFEDFEWPAVSMMDYSQLRKQCEKYDDYAIMYGFGDLFTRPSIVRGFENFLLDMYENPEFVHFLVKKFTDFYLEEYTRAYKESGNRIDIFLVMSDLATQIAPLFAPAMFDVYIAPHLKRLADRIHELGAYFMYHTCGESYEFIDKLIACGVDIVDPMQRTSEKMSPEKLFADFGGKVCFHGGIDVQTTLPYGTLEEVRAEVRRYTGVFRDDLGYICCSAHYMQHDTPPENILAMYDEIHEIHR